MIDARIPVLDHGFVRLVEAWGHGDEGLSRREFDQDDRVTHVIPEDYEVRIIEAARQSTQGNFRGWDTDEKLLAYLYNNRHDTPFEFSGMVLEIRAPIFVFREWHRHRTQSYNEMSARYAPLPDLNYVPTIERLMIGVGDHLQKNKQAGAVRDAEVLTREAAERFLDTLQGQYTEFEVEYQAALKNGVPKELARLGMPVGRYSQMRASANLRNWLAFLTLRTHHAAQWEIRQYANAVAEVTKETFPHSYALFEKIENKMKR